MDEEIAKTEEELQDDITITPASSREQAETFVWIFSMLQDIDDKIMDNKRDQNRILLMRTQSLRLAHFYLNDAYIDVFPQKTKEDG